METLEAFGALTDAFEQSFQHFEAQCMAAVEGTEEILLPLSSDERVRENYKVRK